MEEHNCNCNFHFSFNDRWVSCSLPFNETFGIIKLSYWKEKYYTYTCGKEHLGRLSIIGKNGLTTIENSPSVEGLFYKDWWNIIESTVQITMAYEGKATDEGIYVEELGSGIYVLLFDLNTSGIDPAVLYLKEPPRILVIYSIQYDLGPSYLEISNKEYLSKLIIRKKEKKYSFKVPVRTIYWYSACLEGITRERAAVDNGNLYLASHYVESDVLYYCALHELIPGAKIVLNKKLILPRIETSRPRILLSPCISELVVNPRLFAKYAYSAFSNIPQYENFWVSALK